jgi:thiol-disulfide isomerase/thioredoxin
MRTNSAGRTIGYLITKILALGKENDMSTTRRTALAALLALPALIACRPTPATEGSHASPGGASVRVPPPAVAEPVPETRVPYYKQALPEAQSFTKRRIPREMLRAFDEQADSYVEARNAAGKPVGYLRDVTGPVSPSAACPCNPLNVTLVFNADHSFRTLVTPAPLQKLGHVELSPAETARMIEIMKQPAAELTATKRVEDVVDATSGATKLELQKHVVPQAGLSTRRLVGLVQDTQQILRGAPLAWDKARLDEILAQEAQPLARARALGSFLGSAESPEVAQYAYRVFTSSYEEAIAAGAARDATIEGTLVRPGLDEAIETSEVAAACHRLSSQAAFAKPPAGERQSFIERCAAALPASPASLEARALRSRLAGTVAWHNGDRAAALRHFTDAAVAIDIFFDPVMHLRLTQGLAEQGDAAGACARARMLYTEHPLLEGVRQTLASCGDAAAEAATLERAGKERLLRERKEGSTPVPDLELESLDLKQVQLDLAKSGKVTVLVFFATWCPHCQAEMPRLVDFAGRLKKDASLTGRVQVIGVRTSLERETESYESFAARYRPNFTVYTDPTMSLAFSRFAKAVGISPGLPTVAVIDHRGVLRYLVSHGDHRDSAKELTWAVQSLLPDSVSAK